MKRNFHFHFLLPFPITESGGRTTETYISEKKGDIVYGFDKIPNDKFGIFNDLRMILSEESFSMNYKNYNNERIVIVAKNPFNERNFIPFIWVNYPSRWISSREVYLVRGAYLKMYERNDFMHKKITKPMRIEFGFVRENSLLFLPGITFKKIKNELNLYAFIPSSNKIEGMKAFNPIYVLWKHNKWENGIDSFEQFQIKDDYDYNVVIHRNIPIPLDMVLKNSFAPSISILIDIDDGSHDINTYHEISHDFIKDIIMRENVYINYKHLNQDPSFKKIEGLRDIKYLLEKRKSRDYQFGSSHKDIDYKFNILVGKNLIYWKEEISNKEGVQNA